MFAGTNSLHDGTTMMASLATCPSELLLEISRYLTAKDLNSFLRTGRRYAHLFTAVLYKDEEAGALLCWAATHNRPAVARLMLDFYDASPRATHEYTTPLRQAARKGHTDIVRLLLDRDPTMANESCSFSWRPKLCALHIATTYGHYDLVKLLLDRGADPNLPQERRGGITLESPAAGGDVEIVRLLLDRGASVRTATTALVCAIQMSLICPERAARCRQVAVLLIQRGVSCADTLEAGRSYLPNSQYFERFKEGLEAMAKELDFRPAFVTPSRAT